MRTFSIKIQNASELSSTYLVRRGIHLKNRITDTVNEKQNKVNKKQNMCTEISELECSEFPLADLPDELLLNVLSWLPGSELLNSCSLVNKHWNDVIKQQKLWHDKCVRIGIYNSEYMSFRPADFRTYFFKNPYTRNLVKNPCAEEGMKHWIVDMNFGNRFKCEERPVGSHPVRQFNDKVQGDIGCWATSYGWCVKHQLIDLLEEGCEEVVLEKVRPEIEISEWFAARFDCGIEYSLDVQLLDKDKKVLDKVEFSETRGAGRDWFHVEHIFIDYPSGLRYIMFKHGGRDTQFWAGHYGAKITLSTVKFNLRNK